MKRKNFDIGIGQITEKMNSIMQPVVDATMSKLYSSEMVAWQNSFNKIIEPIANASLKIQCSAFPMDGYIKSMREALEPIVEMQTNIDKIIESTNRLQETLLKPIASASISNIITSMEMFSNNKVFDRISTLGIGRIMDSYLSIVENINLGEIKFYENGNIEYSGEIFEKEEITEASNEIIEYAESNVVIKTPTILTKIIISIFMVFILLAVDKEYYKAIIILMEAGFWGEAGSDFYTFIKNRFKNLYKKEIVQDEYFEKYCAFIQCDKVKIKKEPNKDANCIGVINFGRQVEILEQLGSWVQIKVCIDEENNTYTIGWVYANSLKKAGRIKKVIGNHDNK